MVVVAISAYVAGFRAGIFLPLCRAFNSVGTMRSCYLLLFAFLFCAQIAKGQGTFLFTWQGQSNFFHASFELTAADMLPGGRFTSQLFYNSMTVDSLSGESYHGGTSASAGSGGFYPDAPGFFL